MTNPKLIDFLSFSLSFDNRNSGVLRSNSMSLCIQWRRPESMRIASKSWTQLGGLGRSIDIKGAKNRKQWRPLLHTRQKLMYPIMKGSKLWQRDEIAKLTKFSKDNHSCDLHLRKKKGETQQQESKYSLRYFRMLETFVSIRVPFETRARSVVDSFPFIFLVVARQMHEVDMGTQLVRYPKIYRIIYVTTKILE